MFLPAFAAITYFSSWAFSQASPLFWEDNIEPNIGMGFSTFTASLSFVVLLGYILAVGFHRYRVSISLATFHQLVEQSNIDHRSVQSLQGYDGLLYQLENAMSHHTKSLFFACCSALMLIAVLWNGTSTEFGNYSSWLLHPSWFSRLANTCPLAQLRLTWLNRLDCSLPTRHRSIHQPSTWSSATSLRHTWTPCYAHSMMNTPRN